MQRLKRKVEEEVESWVEEEANKLQEEEKIEEEEEGHNGVCVAGVAGERLRSARRMGKKGGGGLGGRRT